MKNLFLCLLLATLFLSCSKEKQNPIVGTWKFVALYHKDSRGTFVWIDYSNSRYPSILNLGQDGRYGSHSDVPEGHGTYTYNIRSREIVFTDSNGNYELRYVSHLDPQFLTIDLFSNELLLAKLKYKRLKY